MTSFPLSSPHVHSQFCDGRNTAEEMVLAAISRGFVSLGISSHFDYNGCISATQENEYVAHIQALSDKYSDRIRLWLGAERDCFSDVNAAKFDYTIGSVHYFRIDGDYFSIDGNPKILVEAIDKHFGGSGTRMAIAYYRQLGDYISAFRPDIIGHFDLVMRHNQNKELFDPEDPKVMAAAFECMQQAVAGCSLMEVNTGAIPRFGALSPYPALALLKYWRSLGGEVILASDCHSADQIDGGYVQGLQRIRDAGYTQMKFLGRKKELFETAAL
jgi:histidinol-phosphatase (PHP family)